MSYYFIAFGTSSWRINKYFTKYVVFPNFQEMFASRKVRNFRRVSSTLHVYRNGSFFLRRKWSCYSRGRLPVARELGKRSIFRRKRNERKGRRAADLEIERGQSVRGVEGRRLIVGITGIPVGSYQDCAVSIHELVITDRTYSQRNWSTANGCTRDNTITIVHYRRLRFAAINYDQVRASLAVRRVWKSFVGRDRPLILSLRQESSLTSKLRVKSVTSLSRVNNVALTWHFCIYRVKQKV